MWRACGPVAGGRPVHRGDGDARVEGFGRRRVVWWWPAQLGPGGARMRGALGPPWWCLPRSGRVAIRQAPPHRSRASLAVVRGGHRRPLAVVQAGSLALLVGVLTSVVGSLGFGGVVVHTDVVLVRRLMLPMVASFAGRPCLHRASEATRGASRGAGVLVAFARFGGPILASAVGERERPDRRGPPGVARVLGPRPRRGPRMGPSTRPAPVRVQATWRFLGDLGGLVVTSRLRRCHTQAPWRGLGSPQLQRYFALLSCSPASRPAGSSSAWWLVEASHW